MKKVILYTLLFNCINVIFGQDNPCTTENFNSWNFLDSNENNLTIHTNKKDFSKIYYDSEFIISDQNDICDFYPAMDDFKIEVLRDTLNVYTIHNLCLGDNFECETQEVIKKSYFFKNNKFQTQRKSLIPKKSNVSKQNINAIHKIIDNIEILRTDNVFQNLKNINNFIDKLEVLAIYGDLKSFLKLVELNMLSNPEISYNSRNAIKIVLELNYLNEKKDSIQQKLSDYLIYQKH